MESVTGQAQLASDLVHELYEVYNELGEKNV